MQDYCFFFWAFFFGDADVGVGVGGGGLQVNYKKNLSWRKHRSIPG